LGVDLGKRCTYLDLRNPHELETMLELASDADVFASTYRTSVNERFGLTATQLAERSKRGIVCLSANAYGHDGPWKDRPGFDQNGQVASGFAVKEGGEGPPRFSPVFYLADLMTGYFAAAGMMAALLRRSVEGGSYEVTLSLARSAMWVQELGFLSVADQGGIAEKDEYPARVSEVDSVYGKLSFLAPPLRFSNLLLPNVVSIEPYGASPPRWNKKS
jgi:crotonobetainyl-CoA:carnitine CoA-transferase CaiB-like acyl-CoA transferase